MRQPVCFFIVLSCFFLSTSTSASAKVFSNDEIHIAVVSDLGGYLAESSGQGSIMAADLAVADRAAIIGDTPVRLSLIDHKHDPARARREVRQLHAAEGLDAIVEMASPNVALALYQLAAELDIVALHSVGVSGKSQVACSPHALEWGPGTYSLGALIAGQIFANQWHLWTLFTPEGQVGENFRSDLSRRIRASGGHVSSAVEHPLGGVDVSAQLIEAVESDSEAVVIATAGTELRNVIRQVYELGIGRRKGLAIINISVFDVRSLGLYAAGGLEFATAFYWDRNDATRAFSERFRKRAGVVPSEVHASVYSAVSHYLRAAMEVGSDRPELVVEAMKATPVQDFYADGAELRADGRLMHAMQWVRVKRSAESAYAWDYLDILEVIPGQAAFLPMSSASCGGANS